MFNIEKHNKNSRIESSTSEDIEKIFEEKDIVVINEGEKGVILFVEESVFNHYVHLEKKTDNDVALKLLKFGAENDLMQEVFVHKQAREIIAQSGKKPDEIAQVPEIIFERAALSPRGKMLEWCNKTHKNLSREKILMFAMDYIPGKNIGELLLAETHRRHPRSPYFKGVGGLEHLPYSSLAIAAEILFSVNGNKDILMDRVFDFLKKDGFVLPSRISTQISRAVAELNKNGLFHRDLHWGNIMITNWGKEDAQAYIIDFGEGTYDSENSTRYQEITQKRHISDAFSAGRYIELSHVSRGISEKIIEKMRKDPVWVALLNNTMISCDLEDSALYTQLFRSWEQLSDKTRFFGLIQTVFLQRPQDAYRLKNLSIQLSKKLAIADANALMAFVEALPDRK